jgi:hypothetical protein
MFLVGFQLIILDRLYVGLLNIGRNFPKIIVNRQFSLSILNSRLLVFSEPILESELRGFCLVFKVAFVEFDLGYQ